MSVNPDQVSLRRLGNRDLELVLAWRNDHEVMRYLPTAQPPLRWEDHFEWFQRYQHLKAHLHWIVVYADGATRPRSVGVVHYNLVTWEIGLLIGEKTLWGQGVGRISLEKALRDLVDPWDQLDRPWAVVHPENLASRRLFEGLNFVEVGLGRDGQIKYKWQGWKQ